MEYKSTHTGEQIDNAVDDVINNKERWNNPSASNVCFTDGENIQQKYDNGQLGVSSWNDLTDKPFYEEADGTIKPLDGKFLPKGTPWIEEGEMEEILPESQMVYNEEEGFFVLESALDLVVGDTYTVNWNGAEYKSVAVDGTALGGTGVIVLGDVYTASGGAVGTESTGEPFMVMVSVEEGVTAAIPLDGSASVTISIYQGDITIHKLDNRCLPELRGQNTFLVDLDNDTTTLTAADVENKDLADLCNSILIKFGDSIGRVEHIRRTNVSQGDISATTLDILFVIRPTDFSLDVRFYTCQVTAYNGLTSAGLRYSDYKELIPPNNANAYEISFFQCRYSSDGVVNSWRSAKQLGLSKLQFITPNNNYYLLSVDDNGNVITTRCDAGGLLI